MKKRSGPRQRLLLATFASFAVGLTSIAGAVDVFAGNNDEVQAPRMMRLDDVQAPRGQETQAPREPDVTPL
jgi:hypothetical protein